MSDKQLKTKIKQRQGTRMNALRKTAKIQPILSGQVDLDRAQLQVSINKLTIYQKNLNLMDDAIVQLIYDDDELDSEINKASELSDLLLEGLAKANQLLTEYTEAQRSQANSPNLNVSGAALSKPVTVKLPKLEMVMFSGEPLKWQEFWDNFDSTINSNDDLSPIEKLKYLRSFLEGDALRLVDGYRLTAANYNAVISTWEDRYGSKQMAVFAHLEAMLALPTANHELFQLRMVSDDCEKHIRSLVTLGLEENTFGQVLTPIILSKLPKYVKMELHRRNGSQAWSLQKLRELLKEEIFARDMSERSFAGKASKNAADNGINEPSHSRNVSKKSPNTKPSSRHQNTASSLVSSARTKCDFCDENYFSDQCKKYPDVRSRQQKSKDKCFNCLTFGHSVRDCKKASSCVYCKKKGHHRSMCFSKFGKLETSLPKETSLTSDGQNAEAKPFTPSATSSLLSHGERTMLETAIGKISDGKNGKKMESRLLFDTGCSRSYITAEMVKKAGLKVTGEDIVSQAGFQSKKRRTERYETVQFHVHGLDGQSYEVTVNMVPTITCPVQKFSIDVRKNAIMREIALAEPLVHTRTRSNRYTHRKRILSPTSIWKDSGVFEDIGIKDKGFESDDESAVEALNKNVRFQEGRYQVTWPWKSVNPELPDDCQLPRCRFGSLLRRIHGDKKVFEAYQKPISDQEASGVIERAPNIPTSDRVYYMPHHCVVTPQKTTTKLRVVYDASSKAKKELCSLNECLHRGPVMLEDLCGMLLRFRLNAVAMVSDIEKAFLQVGLQEQERDCTRFLWIKDVTRALKDDNIVVYRFCRVPFGVVSRPFLLAATTTHHLKSVGTPTASDILSNTYVDNVIARRSNVKKAIAYYKEAKQHFRSASMNLRERFCNSSDFISAVEFADRGKDETPKVLGLVWNVAKDTISCQSVKRGMESVGSKRQVLQSLAKMYDPCGLFAPIIISAKMLIQKLWQKKHGWDDPLSSEMLAEWKKVQSSIELISTFEIAHFVSTVAESTEYRLYSFTDASVKAYAAVVYLQTETPSGIT